ncbi:MAG: sigma-70 family RNA polymerase sigma factor [Verrucomicrobiaceae bacterium]|nr:MAG: sigma-70 family RNA polymerase sigma factor [Verrucomicrobiaceae bacterium]
MTEHLFRHEAGKLVSALTGIFGTARLQLAEDVVQEAMVRALQTWPYHGIPANPAAWLMQTARNRALDVIRREKFFHDKQPEIIASLENWSNEATAAPRHDDEIKDDRLRLIFACCHPLVPQDDQTALALKTLCGFSPGEIARAYLTTEAAIAKRLTRARQKIQDLGIPFEIPSGEELAPRLDGVLQVLYLLFNEGYKATSGDNLVREDLCAEAIRLGSLLVSHPSADQPRTHALLALMLLNAARLPGRVDSRGNILRLTEQDRSTWHRPMIAQGLKHLASSASGDELSEYHLQAIIAASHATAADDASTDWNGILARYDQWLEINDSPVIALNRAVAIAKVHGPTAAIEAVAAIENRKSLENYYLAHAVLGELHARLGHFQAAVVHLQKALDLTDLKSEQSFLLKQLQGYEAHPSVLKP